MCENSILRGSTKAYDKKNQISSSGPVANWCNVKDDWERETFFISYHSCTVLSLVACVIINELVDQYFSEESTKERKRERDGVNIKKKNLYV